MEVQPIRCGYHLDEGPGSAEPLIVEADNGTVRCHVSFFPWVATICGAVRRPPKSTVAPQQTLRMMAITVRLD